MTISIDTAKAHCRILHADEDALIAQYLNAAKGWLANYTGIDIETDTPAEIDQATLLLVEHWYSNRGTVVGGSISSALRFAVDELAGPFRTPTLR